MNKVELTHQKGWVIVKNENAYRYESWGEAVTVNQMLGGSLMSEQFYKQCYEK